MTMMDTNSLEIQGEVAQFFPLKLLKYDTGTAIFILKPP